MNMKIQYKPDEIRPIKELEVRDLWHLASAVAQTSKELQKARDTEIMNGDHGEDVLIELLESSGLHGDGERQREAILDVWHLAHAMRRALLKIEQQAQEAIKFLDAVRHEGTMDRPEIADVRRRFEEILSPAADTSEGSHEAVSLNREVPE